MSLFKRYIVAAWALTVIAMFAPTTSQALASSPWWHLTSQAVPTDIHAGVAQDTVLALSYQATEGDFLLAASEATFFAHHRLVAWNASPQTVQEALLGLFPDRKVEVSGEPGNYEITFPGQTLGKYAYSLTPTQPFVIADSALLEEFFQFGGQPLENDVEGVKTPAEPAMSALFTGRPDGQIVVTATNLGDAQANGETDSPITIADKLPPGIEAVSVVGAAKMWREEPIPLECSLKPTGKATTPTCTFKGTLAPYNSVSLVISVVDVGAKSGETGEAAISGGEARGATLNRAITTGEVTPFGVENYELVNENEGGAPDTQAGSHPFQQTTTIALNQTVNVASGVVEPAALPKDFHFHWPAGLIGNPRAIPQCSLAQFLTEESCPPQTAVGVANVLVTEHGPFGKELEVTALSEPLFNLVPSPGEPARFAFKAAKPVYIDPSVRSGEDYGITVNSENITEIAGLLSAQVTVWGVPGDSSHDDFRGRPCIEFDQGVPGSSCEPVKVEHPAAFLALPTSCMGHLHTEVYGDSWLESKPTAQQQLLASYEMPALDGCDALPFSPELKVTPDGKQASRPTGLNVDVHVPQEESVNPKGFAVASPRNITVALPEGVAVNPASADGLEACSEQLVGFEGFKELAPGFDPATFTSTLPGSFGSEERLEPGRNFCSDASKIATVSIKTPILPNPIEGAVYLAAQNANPFGSLIAMYIVAEDPVSGTLVKLAGQVHLSATGQIVTTFEDSPQAPFEDAEFHFFGGERAPLVTPAHCGVYTASASMTPWAGGAPVPVSSSFEVTSGSNGGACPGTPLPFVPTLAAQTTNIQAGGFSPLVTTISREDGSQDIQQVQLRFPPGLSGVLTGVKLCGEQQANEGTCSSESEIGETIVSVGVGGDPFTVTGGKVYITEKYEGAPFGLSIVTPAVAGPFNLGDVVVRGRLDIDPRTAALTFTSNTEAQGYAIPHVLDGIPLQIRHVNVTIKRPGFTFNPTNCEPMKIEGSIESDEGSSVPVQVPFQVTNCAALKFAPVFEVSTSGKTSKRNGASLHVKLSYPKGPFGTEANIASVKVELPKQLPSRLTTLQEACAAVTFDANPANCPSGSIVGHARVTTPILPVPLEGSAYFVSHGGEAFPSLTIVLKGYGVTVQLVGDTFISKQSITSSTFKATPDVPFSVFELTLPEGKFSALGANANLCKSRLNMPTTFRAQNGAELHQTTRIKVTGCSKHVTHRAKRARRHKRLEDRRTHRRKGM